MIAEYQPQTSKMISWYELVFDDGLGNGLSFPCTAEGKLLNGLNPAAYGNYERALSQPEKYKRFNKVIRHEEPVKNNASGVCACGTKIDLYNEFMGACHCSNCGRWYNVFGQELNPPETWADGDDW